MIPTPSVRSRLRNLWTHHRGAASRRGQLRRALVGTLSLTLLATTMLGSPAAATETPAPVVTASLLGKPYPPDQLGLGGYCLVCESPAAVRSTRPWLQARVSHPDGALLNFVRFQVRTMSGSLVSAGVVRDVSSGAIAQWRPSLELTDGETYQFRVRAHSRGGSSDWSPDFVFTVDTTPPGAPVVWSDFYLPKDTGTWNGGVGQPGPFTFDPDGATDVVEFHYRWLNGDGAVVPVAAGMPAEDVMITPVADMEQVLRVRAVDHAGNVSDWTSYAFLVKPEPPEFLQWKFDEGQGDQALPTNGDPTYAGTLRGSATWGPSGINPSNPAATGTAIVLDGDGYVEMGTVLSTDYHAGFTVMAWVKPDSFADRTVVVSQNGLADTMAALVYDPAANSGQGGWCFEVRHGDGLPDVTSACSSRLPQPGEWVHLAGSYDPLAGQIRLVVDGGPYNGDPVPGTVTTAPAPSAWAATGTFTVGAGLDADHLIGSIDEVRAHQRVLSESEITFAFLQCRYGAC